MLPAVLHTVRQCIDAVRLQYPAANGFTTAYPCPNGCKCWAEFGMTGWNRNVWSIKTRKACKFSDKGKHIIVTTMRPLRDHYAPTVRPLSDQSDLLELP